MLVQEHQRTRLNARLANPSLSPNPNPNPNPKPSPSPNPNPNANSNANQGDPGFLVNGPPLKEAGRLMRLKNGAIVDIPLPRPAYVPPPAYVRPAEPKMTPMQLAQLQMTLPSG